MTEDDSCISLEKNREVSNLKMLEIWFVNTLEAIVKGRYDSLKTLVARCFAPLGRRFAVSQLQRVAVGLS